MKMVNLIIKVLKKICIAFVMLYGLNILLSSINIFIPINVITLILVTLLGSPGILGLVAIYFLI